VTLRRNAITGDPVLFAPERAERPHAFADSKDDARCPFCPGHESDTPPELLRVGEPWRVRVVPNKYPPVPGAEVIIESPDHHAGFHDVTGNVVNVYAERLRAHRDAKYVALFKNEGARAGSSIAHVHSQLVPLPFVPPRVERELAGFAQECPLCAAPGNVIEEMSAFTWFAPHGSSMPYQQWIAPKRHLGSLLETNDGEKAQLDVLLRAASAATRAIGDAYNWVFMNTPHFYVELFPRLTTLGGLELGTGTFVEIIDPAVAAARLRR